MVAAQAGPAIAAPPVRQSGGKLVYAFAAEGDFDTTKLKSNTFKLEWPPRSGNYVDTPEVDRAEWFDLATARQKMNPAQAGFIDQLENLI